MTLTPKERAEKSAETMWAQDAASKWIGMSLDEVDEGRAVLSLKVTDHHCNGFGICHGGISYTLADSAFAFACNSRNQVHVARQVSTSYLAPGKLGDRLTATAREVHVKGRSGIYDVEVRTQDDELIVVFRGESRALGRPHFAENQ